MVTIEVPTSRRWQAGSLELDKRESHTSRGLSFGHDRDELETAVLHHTHHGAAGLPIGSQSQSRQMLCCDTHFVASKVLYG